MTINIFSQIKNVDVLGEVLRVLSFEYYPDKIACYDHFEVNQSLSKIKLSDFDLVTQKIISNALGIDLEESKDFPIYKFSEDNVFMAHFYDSSGTLLFLSSEKMLINDDCKKNYGWKIYEV